MLDFENWQHTKFQLCFRMPSINTIKRVHEDWYSGKGHGVLCDSRTAEPHRTMGHRIVREVQPTLTSWWSNKSRGVRSSRSLDMTTIELYVMLEQRHEHRITITWRRSRVEEKLALFAPEYSYSPAKHTLLPATCKILIHCYPIGIQNIMPVRLPYLLEFWSSCGSISWWNIVEGCYTNSLVQMRE